MELNLVSAQRYAQRELQKVPGFERMIGAYEVTYDDGPTVCTAIAAIGGGPISMEVWIEDVGNGPFIYGEW
jgi:hypothetical protein